MDWKKISIQKQMIDAVVKEQILSHWMKMDRPESLPDVIRHFLPQDVDFFLFLVESETDIPTAHRFGLDQLSLCEDEPLHVTGTLDAANSSDYRPLFDQFGWRTVVYMYVDIVQEPMPDPGSRNDRHLAIKVPAALVSREPDALNEQDLESIFNLVDIALSAMLLRIGVTYFASRSQHLWDSIPGSLLLISPDSVFEANDEARRWFDLDVSPREPRLLKTIFPERLCHWIESTIGSDGQYSTEKATDAFWLDDTQRIHASLRPYRPWEKIPLTKRMATGYKGIETDQINTRLHLLLLRDVTREWEADIMEQEVQLARRMQIGLQPEAMPQTPVFDIVGSCQPAHDIGGDLYDAVSLDDGRIALVIGDATGHGVDSALLAAVVSGAFRSSVATDPDPQAVLNRIDGVLRRTQQHGFVTLIYMLLEEDGSVMQYGLAGHYPPFIFRQHDLVPESITPESLPLGVSLPSHYHIDSVSLSPGDIIAAFSDGFLECRNAAGEMFLHSIPGIIRRQEGENADSLMKALLNGVNGFSGNPMQQDDFTAIIVRINNPVRHPSWKKSALRLWSEGAGLSSAILEERSDESVS